MLCLVVLLLLVSVRSGRNIAASAEQEYAIKAAFLFNFVKFIEWPAETFASSGQELMLCILGANPFGTALASIDGKIIDNRTLVVRQLTSQDAAPACHLLFISASEEDRLAQILHLLQGQHVLTVSETAHFTQAGGMINFVMSDKKIRFEINPDAAQHAGLKISSKLLKLADITK